MTALDWFFTEVLTSLHGTLSKEDIDNILIKAKKKEKEELKEHLVNFQIHLNLEGFITNHDWDFEKEAKVYLYDIDK